MLVSSRSIAYRTATPVYAQFVRGARVALDILEWALMYSVFLHT